MDATPAGDRLRDLRRHRGLTQEALAETAGLSIGVIKKIERGGTARIETYHALARALGVRTSALFEPSGPGQDTHADETKLDLLALRQAISPPVTITGRLGFVQDDDEEPDLDRLRATAEASAIAYHRDKYPAMGQLLPDLVKSTHTAVDHFTTGPERDTALSIRSEVLQMAGRYLTQVRAYDLAHMALTDAVRDAVAAADRLNAASAIIGQAWILLRQGRLDEAEQIAASTADEVEPRLSSATREELAAWGWLLLRASAAAARNNRPAEAREFARLAATAGGAVGAEVTDHLRGWGTFGPLTVRLKAIENQMVADRPDQVLAMADRLPAGVGRSTSDNWNRHRLDVACAHAALRQGTEATTVLVGLRRQAPEWLRHQRLAARTLRDVLALRKRSLTRDQRELAAFLAVDGA
ncbi:helix-turn-helix domain-containing protein [Nocardiopsis sp. FIRDI 009]|uniref:helix-turn-helix domain-containing protein n=1 Tax=Nocardiopsis sp. FIRDI 009 TaxID=714197 RepID=UPI000E27B70C|nr:helix-turn-helix transcriptional regulator [Nocardiopsis sp. FIRDI 009]